MLPCRFEEDENMSAGTYGHRLLDIYYRARYRHMPFKDSIELVYSYNPDKDMCECGCSLDLHNKLEALGIEECTRCKRCMAFRPKPFPLNTKDRQKIQKRFNEYAVKYAKDDFMPLSENHVEVGFSNIIYEDSENQFILEGRIDLIAKWQQLEAVFVDHKFQAKTYYLYPKTIQFKNYALATGITTGVINYIRTAEKSKEGLLLDREILNFNQIELAAWQKRVVQIFFRVKKALQSSQNNGKNEIEHNWNACNGMRLTYDKNKPQFCWYTPLCETVDQQVLESREKTLYKINENPWRPW
jgi:hypothetical protein